MNDEMARIPVAELLPQDPPMVLIDRLLDWGENHLSAEVRIGPDALFADEHGNVAAWVGLEYMAQAVAALAGVRARLRGVGAPIGLLLGTRGYHAEVGYFMAGERLRVTAKSVYEEQHGVGVFDCSILTDRTLAQARINTYQPDSETLDNILRPAKQ